MSTIQNDIDLKLAVVPVIPSSRLSTIQNDIDLKLLLIVMHYLDRLSTIQNDIDLKPQIAPNLSQMYHREILIE